MNQTYSLEKYMESRIIGRLEHMMDGGGMYDDTPWYSCTWEQENNIKRDPEYGCILHKKMLPYYGMYLNGDTRLCKKNMENNYPDLIEEIDFGYAVISKDKLPDFKNTKRAQKQLSNGYYLSTNFSTDTKAEILEKVSEELGLGLIIKIIDKD